MTKAPKPSKADLVPIDWDKVKLAYEAGLTSNRKIAEQFGCSHTAVAKRAAEYGWVRKLKDQIISRADEIVARGSVAIAVAKSSAGNQEKPSADDRQTIEVNAQALALVQLAHRGISAEMRTLAKQLLAEAMAHTLEPELFVRVRDVLEQMDDKPTDAQRDDMRLAMAAVASHSGRVKVLKDLAELTAKIIGMEREASGLNAQEGTGERFTVVVKDYTGRGDPDSPRSREKAPEDA